MVMTGVLAGGALAAEESSPLLMVMTGVLVGGSLTAYESPPLLMVMTGAAADRCRGAKTTPSRGGSSCATVADRVDCSGRGSTRSIGAAPRTGADNLSRTTGRSGTGATGGAAGGSSRGGVGTGSRDGWGGDIAGGSGGSGSRDGVGSGGGRGKSGGQRGLGGGGDGGGDGGRDPEPTVAAVDRMAFSPAAGARNAAGVFSCEDSFPAKTRRTAAEAASETAAGLDDREPRLASAASADNKR